MSAKQRKALGRGFGALLKSVDDVDTSDNSSSVAQLDIDTIGTNPKQPRKTIDDGRLEELARSIKTKGVIHPILVRPQKKGGKNYELVAGERRLRASKLAGYDKIPALIRPIKDRDLLEIALIENIQRDNLNPIDEAKAYRNLLDEFNYTQDDLAKRVGKNRSTIANLIRLLQLPESIQVDLASDKLTTGHARTLLSLDDPKEQQKLRNKILKDNISVRETEEIVRTEKKASGRDSGRRTVEPLSSQMSLIQDRLGELFATKVRIKSGSKKGKIEFEYFGQEDFNRIYSLLIKKRNS
ncbi:MAG: ParB/RepB/Spo0J family partition protein [Proteobacteria bacterium]|nr:ParB/RepB/Spo0J family partition protein [Pseudomonadota bacterium]